MKIFHPRLLVILLLTLIPSALNSQESSLAQKWTSVKKAQSLSQPKTASAILDEIITESLKEKSHVETVKAILLKARMDAPQDSRSGRLPFFINTLSLWINNTPPISEKGESRSPISEEMKIVLEASITKVWTDYYQENRWRLLQRDKIRGNESEDILTWDASRVLEEIDRRFRSILSSPETLQKISVESLLPLLSSGDVPLSYRPTLYDFLAFEAIVFYSYPERKEWKSPESDRFIAQLSTGELPLSAPLEDFLAWDTSNVPNLSVKRSVELYQNLLRFHQEDPEPRTALADADFHRVKYASGFLKNHRLKVELFQNFINRWSGNPAVIAAYPQLIGLLEKENPLKAHSIANEGLKLNIDSPYSEICKQAVTRIEAPEIQNTRTTVTWVTQRARIFLSYRNIDEVFFRLIPLSLTQMYNDDDYEDIKTPHTKQWSVPLKPTPDFEFVDKTISAPQDLKPGAYMLVASIDDKFINEKSIFAYAKIWVSTLFLAHDSNMPRHIRGIVTNAITGEPLPETEVSFLSLEENGEPQVLVRNRVEDAFSLKFPSSLKKKSNHTYFLMAKDNDGNAISSHHYFNFRSANAPKTRSYVHIITDRSLYRPGQTVHFKGIVFKRNSRDLSLKIEKNKKTKIRLMDAFGNEASSMELKSNEFGSIHGHFTIPRGGGTGRFSIEIDSSVQSGSTDFHVEEYKRPKFEVTLKAPDKPSFLGSTVIFPGNAISYTGIPVSNATVSYTVKLEPYSIWSWRRQGASRILRSGETRTDEKGSFSISFKAEAPYESSNEKGNIFSRYTVSAEITDSTGETHTASETFNVGDTALAVEVSHMKYQIKSSPVKFQIQTKTLNNIPLSAKGEATVWSLKQPDAVSHENDTLNDWSLDKKIKTLPLETDSKTGLAKMQVSLPAGAYQISAEISDPSGLAVTGSSRLRVLSLENTHYDIKEPFIVVGIPKTPDETDPWSASPGESVSFLWGSGYESARAFVSIEKGDDILRQFWTTPGLTQQTITIPITESMRGGISLRVLQVRENKLSQYLQNITVPWDNKKLQLKWTRFNSKLNPGKQESWELKITPLEGESSIAELASVLYDESLDQFRPHFWSDIRRWKPTFRSLYTNTGGIYPLRQRYIGPKLPYTSPPRYLYWNPNYQFSLRHIGPSPVYAGMSFGSDEDVVLLDEFSVSAGPMDHYIASESLAGTRIGGAINDIPYSVSVLTQELVSDFTLGDEHGNSLKAVSPRKNLNETAFFYPSLKTDSEGLVKIDFTVPEALTRWKFLGFAHDKELRSGVITTEAVTAKDLMVQPNPPRFLREGDTVEFVVKITNTSNITQSGTTALSFTDALSYEPVKLSEISTQSFTLEANSSKTLSWPLHVPEGQGFLIYKAVAATETVSDGEEAFLPVLSKRQLLAESLALHIPDKGSRSFRFEKLSTPSPTSRTKSLTLEVTSNPSWYALLALPSLMEFPHECSEQLFNRYYANTLAAHILKSNPRIASVFEQWRDTPALDSPLFRNDEFKSILLEETPWLRDAAKESEQRRSLAQQFLPDQNTQQARDILKTLRERQLPNGLWGWFSGGDGNEYITRYMVTGFARLKHFGISNGEEERLVKQAIQALDSRFHTRFEKITEIKKPNENNLSSGDAYQLYTRSFYLKELPIQAEYKKAYDYFISQTRNHWMTLPRQSQGHAALALKRLGFPKDAELIVESLRQHAQTDPDLGMWWPQTECSWLWWNAPIETQALMIEVFDEVANDEKSAAACQLWLLNQKRTQAWPSTKSTADAVHALLLRGTDKLASNALTTVTLGGKTIVPDKAEAGTGFYSKKIPAADIIPTMADVSMTKTDRGPAWGSLTWQYLEDISKITAPQDSPLAIKKTLYKQVQSENGPALIPLSATELKPGDLLLVRLEIKTDRDMEFIHLKDQRGSGTEPVNVLSGYRWKERLAYYESTRDTATHFFIDYLPRGTHIVEYQIRPQLRGQYESGIAEIQCMYAPEYRSHSTSTTLVVK